MKKSIIVVLAGILASIASTFLGSHDISISEEKIEDALVEVGEEFLGESPEESKSTNSLEIENTYPAIVMNEVRWAPGEFEDPYKNIIHHFEKHGNDVGVESAQAYYDLANNIIQNSQSYRIDGLYCDTCVDYFDNPNNFIVGLNPCGSINTLHRVTSASKLQDIEAVIYQ